MVLVLPESSADWCCVNPDKLILKDCAYWLSLKGFPEIEENQGAKTVHLPKIQLFNDAVLQTWFNEERARVKR